MAGDLIAIAENLALPAQPTLGTVTYLTLGGDGYQAPFASYTILDWQIEADASGGRAVYNCNMDMRFVSLVSFIAFQGTQANTLDVDVRYQLGGNAGVPRAVVVKDLHAASLNAVSQQLGDIFTPPPILLPGGQAATFTVETDNVDTDDYFLSALIYLFNIDVRQKAPSGPLLWARGVT